MSKTGYFEHWEREHLGSIGKYSVFKSTIESYNKSLEDGNYPLGFLIASSLLEDRIKSVWVIVEGQRYAKNLKTDKMSVVSTIMSSRILKLLKSLDLNLPPLLLLPLGCIECSTV